MKKHLNLKMQDGSFFFSFGKKVVEIECDDITCKKVMSKSNGPFEFLKNALLKAIIDFAENYIEEDLEISVTVFIANADQETLPSYQKLYSPIFEDLYIFTKNHNEVKFGKVDFDYRIQNFK